MESEPTYIAAHLLIPITFFIGFVFAKIKKSVYHTIHANTASVNKVEATAHDLKYEAEEKRKKSEANENNSDNNEEIKEEQPLIKAKELHIIDIALEDIGFKELNDLQNDKSSDGLTLSPSKVDFDSNDISIESPSVHQTATDKYENDKNDATDVIVGNIMRTYFEKNGALPMQFRRVGKGQYMIGSHKFTVNIKNGNALIRVGGGYVALYEYIVMYIKKYMELRKQRNSGMKIAK